MKQMEPWENRIVLIKANVHGQEVWMLDFGDAKMVMMSPEQLADIVAQREWYLEAQKRP